MNQFLKRASDGVLGVAACLGGEYPTFLMRLKQNRRPMSYLAGNILQALGLYLAYAIIYMLIYEEVG